MPLMVYDAEDEELPSLHNHPFSSVHGIDEEAVLSSGAQMWSSLSSCLTGELRQGYSTEMPGPHREETPRLPGENTRRPLY